MYTRNFALSRYNHASLPAGCSVEPEAMQAPGHLRVLFQVVGGATGRTRAATVPGAAHLLAGPGTPVIAALANTSTYDEALLLAKNTAWTRKVSLSLLSIFLFSIYLSVSYTCRDAVP